MMSYTGTIDGMTHALPGLFPMGLVLLYETCRFSPNLRDFLIFNEVLARNV
jgi:hypothetical protein